MRYMVTEKVPKVLFPLRALFKFWFVDVLNTLALTPFKVNKPISYQDENNTFGKLFL